MEIFPDTLLCCSPEKYVLRFAAGTLPKESRRYVVEYQFTDGSVKNNIPVEVLGTDVLLVCHPAIKKPCKFTATLYPIGNKTAKCASYNMRILSPMEYIYKKVFCPSSRNQDSLFSLDPNTTHAFFAAVLAYYSNVDCDSDHANIDIMMHNLLHCFDTFCGDDKRWNIADITTGMFGNQENLLHLSLRRQFESSASYLVNTFLSSYEHVLLEKARNEDTAADLANKNELKSLESQIRRKTADLQAYEVINTTANSTKEDKENDYQSLLFTSPNTPVVQNNFSANEVDEGQIDFIQTLKRSTISVATAKCDFVPTGGIGCIPLNKGELVHIIKHQENGWCFGVATDKYGYFPATSVKVDLDLGYVSGSGVVDKGYAVPFCSTSATKTISSVSSKIMVNLLDESKTTGIPSLEALKARSQYQAKILEYYQVSYLSPLRSPKVELKAGDVVDVLEEVDVNWCRAIFESFVCLVPKAILTTDFEDAYVFMNTTEMRTPVIQRKAAKKKTVTQNNSKQKKTAGKKQSFNEKDGNDLVAAQKKPNKGNDVVNDSKAPSAPVSHAIKKPVRKAPPPPTTTGPPTTPAPVPPSSTTGPPTTPAPPPPTYATPLSNGSHDKMSPISPPVNYINHKPPESPALESPVFIEQRLGSTTKPPITSPKPKLIKKSVSFDEIHTPPADNSLPPAATKIPPKPPMRGSSLINEIVDDSLRRHSSCDENEAIREIKPVPKKRTKSIHH